MGAHLFWFPPCHCLELRSCTFSSFPRAASAWHDITPAAGLKPLSLRVFLDRDPRSWHRTDSVWLGSVTAAAPSNCRL